ncbi:unnamed protein product [Prunus armeniaca]
MASAPKYCVCVVVFQLLVTSLAGGDQFLVNAHIKAFESYYFKELGDPCLLPVALRLGRADKHDNKADVSCKKENLPEFDRERGTVRGSSSSTDQIEDQFFFCDIHAENYWCDVNEGEEKKVHKASLLVLCLKLIHLQQQLIAEDMVRMSSGSLNFSESMKNQIHKFTI